MDCDVLTTDMTSAVSGKLKSIPQLLHQGIISTTSSASNLSSNSSLNLTTCGTMDFLRKKRRIKFNTDSRLSCGVTALLELFTYISIVVYHWLHFHFIHRSGPYFTYAWFENVIIVVVAQCLFKMFKLPKHTFIKNVPYLTPLFLLNGCVTVVTGYDFVTDTRNSAGSEFYQVSLILFVPALLAVLNTISTWKSPWLLSSVISLCTLVKMSFILQDTEFSFPFTRCVGSMVFVFVYVSYFICLKTDLQKYTALELIYSLSTMGLLLLPVFALERGELSSQHLTWRVFTGSLLGGGVKLCMLYFTFVLLKHTDPVKTMVVLNAAFVPHHFIQALVYKLDCHISACKMCFFILVDFVMGHVRRKDGGGVGSGVEERDERIRYSLMR